MSKVSAGSEWYPTTHQLKDPDSLERAFRQVLKQHYDLQARFNSLSVEHTGLKKSLESRGGPPPGSGPTDTMILGLRVLPVDVQTLANGATLKWNKSSGNFSFQ